MSPLSTPPQHPCQTPYNVGCGPRPLGSPMSTRATSTVSETDPEDNFPVISDSKYSAGIYYHVTDTSPGAEAWSQSHAKYYSDIHHHSHHPYRQPPCLQDIHTFDNLLGRPGCHKQSEATDTNTDEVFLRHMDGLSLTTCCFVVHYKEAVCERQYMCLFTIYWELEETNRLHSLLMSLYSEADLEFRKTEQETQGLLKALVTTQSLSRVSGDVEYLTAACHRSKESLRETDAQLDLLKDRIMPKNPIKPADNLENCVA
ncbi:hypothetical protein EDD22DRAFT_960730 [Suillus occidentalis]|nr:hypothetical protein EDD22DRAFT_960730 [Suillus occidentalis]